MNLFHYHISKHHLRKNVYSQNHPKNGVNFGFHSFLLKRIAVLSDRKTSICFSTSLKSSFETDIFWNFSFDKGRLKSFVSWFLKTHGEFKTIELVEHLKDLGFGYATKAGISLGIDDLKIPPQKEELLYQAETTILKGTTNYKNGRITGIERLQQLIETWNQTSETLKQEVIRYFESTDPLNPVYMMAFSGARGNLSQVRQLVGMRGLMADPQGQIMDFPIQSNFREGLTLTEYLISTYGARKGIVDTALRTATAGYLTRRLVDVAQHVIVAQFDCGTMRGIFVFDIKDGNKTIYSFQNRLIGRVLAEPIYNPNSELNTFQKLASRNEEISFELAQSISKMAKKALVRSPLTCETRKSVCQLCYGWSLSGTRLVSIGEAVGVIAAQSIGEPGTQLTMRTFHTGGVFSGGLTDPILAVADGIVEYSEPVPGCCIRTPDGQIAFLTKMPVSFYLRKKGELFDETDLQIIETYQIPAYSILFARHKQEVTKKQLLAQFSTVSQEQIQQGNAEQTVYSTIDGQIYFRQVNLLEQKSEKYEDLIRRTEDWAKVWILSGRLYYDPLNSYFFGKTGDLVQKTSILNQIEWQSPENGFLNPSIFKFDLTTKWKQKKVISDKLDSFLFHPIFTKPIFNKKISLNPKKKYSHKLSFQKSFQSVLSTISKNRDLYDFYPIYTKTNTILNSPKSHYLKIHSLSNSNLLTNYKFLKTVPPFYSPYSHFKRKMLFQKFLRLNFFSGTLQKILSLHYKNKKMIQNYYSPLNLRNSQDPFWIFRNQNFKKDNFRVYLKSKTITLNVFHDFNTFMPMFLKHKTPKNLQQVFALKSKILCNYKKQLKKEKMSITSSPKSSFFVEKRNEKDVLFITRSLSLSAVYSFFRETKKQKKEEASQSRMDNITKFFFKKETNTIFAKKQQFQKRIYRKPKDLTWKSKVVPMPSLIVRKPVLCLYFEQIFYKNIGYNFSLSIKSSVFSNRITKQKYFEYFYNSKIDYLQKSNLKKSMCFDSDVFENKKIPTLSSKNIQIRTEKFLSFMTLNNSKQNLKNEKSSLTLDPYSKNKSFNSTQNWDKDPNRFFYWLPSQYQTITNGMFIISKPFNSFINHKNWKRKTSIHSLTQLVNLSQSQSPVFTSKWTYKFTKNGKLVDPQSLNKRTIMWNNLFHLKNNPNRQYHEEFSKVQFCRIRSTLNWHFISNDFQKNPKTKKTVLPKSLKLSVSNTSLFWIPQDNYSIWNLETKPILQIHTYFTKNRLALFYLTNKQGLKKPIYTHLDGFVELSPSKNSSLLGKSVQYPTKIGNYTTITSKYNYTPLDSLQDLKSLLKTKLVHSFKKKWLLKEQQKSQPTFCSQFSNSKHKPKPIISRIASFPFKTNNFNLLPLQKKKDSLENSPYILENKVSLLSQTIQSPILQNISITVRPGWVYLLNDSFQYFHLHQSIRTVGKCLLNDICFEQNPIYTELVFVKYQTKISFEINQKEKQWKPKSWIVNSNSRFISDRFNVKMLNNQTISQYGSQDQIAILIRPMYYKSLENTQHFKKMLYNFQNKERENSLTLFSYKNYHSNVYNLQTANRRFLATFPRKDFVLESNFRLPKKKQQKEKSKKAMFWNLRRNVVPSKESAHSIKNFPIRKDDPQNFLLNAYPKRISVQNNKLYFSAFPIHFQPLMFKIERSSHRNAGFITPFVSFNTRSSFCFQKLNRIVPNSLWYHNMLNRIFFSKAVQNKNPIKYIQKESVLTKNLNFQNKKLQNYEVLHDFHRFCDLPCFDFAMSQKYSNFTNQRILASHYLNSSKSSVWSKSIRFSSPSFQSFNFYPVTKHDLWISNENFIFLNASFAKTNFLSPYNGEIVSIFTKTPSKKKQKSFKSSKDKEKWWESNETLYSFSAKSQAMHVFVTKKDLFSFSFPTFPKSLSFPFEETIHSEMHDVFKYPLGKKQAHLFNLYKRIFKQSQKFALLENKYYEQSNSKNYKVNSFKTKYKNKLYVLNNLNIGYGNLNRILRLGQFLVSGDFLYSDVMVTKPGQIIHMNSQKITLRRAEPISVSPKGILHAYHDQYIFQNSPVVTLPFQTLKTGDIVQGIPKVEQYFEARTTQKGRLFISSLPVLLQGIFERYCSKFPLDQAVRQSFLKIQQMVVDGVQRVYRSQGVSIADKHLEIVVRQMTSKVQIIHGGQTGFFPGELVDLEFVERVNQFLTVKIRYQPVVLGITRASLEVESFLSAASFQQTTKILAKASLSRKKDFLKGLKENLLVGNLIPSGTGYVMPTTDFSN